MQNKHVEQAVELWHSRFSHDSSLTSQRENLMPQVWLWILHLNSLWLHWLVISWTLEDTVIVYLDIQINIRQQKATLIFSQFDFPSFHKNHHKTYQTKWGSKKIPEGIELRKSVFWLKPFLRSLRCYFFFLSYIVCKVTYKSLLQLYLSHLDLSTYSATPSQGCSWVAKMWHIECLLTSITSPILMKLGMMMYFIALWPRECLHHSQVVTAALWDCHICLRETYTDNRQIFTQMPDTLRAMSVGY